MCSKIAWKTICLLIGIVLHALAANPIFCPLIAFLKLLDCLSLWKSKATPRSGTRLKGKARKWSKEELVQSPRKCKSASLAMSFCWGEGELTANLLHCCNLLCMLTIRNFTWLCNASCSPKEACTSFLKAWKGLGKGRLKGARAAVTRRVWTQSLHPTYMPLLSKATRPLSVITLCHINIQLRAL